jgi:hypothetical protein
VRVKAGERVVFRADGRVAHSSCGEVICPLCARPIVRDQPIRRDADVPVHGNCWWRRYRRLA